MLFTEQKKTNYVYDIIEYESHPYSQTHPEHLYTIARLFGLRPPDFKTARVLELGCGACANILPMACLLPDARFTGIDLSHNAIEKGKSLAEELKLTNLALHNCSILDINKDFGEFDYIVCHGVFSWVPRNVQEKILEIIHDNMAIDGVADVSYNTLPGWNIVKSFRDMMLYHIKQFDSYEEKAEQARTLLNFVSDALKKDESPYAKLLRHEMEILAYRSDSYLTHDHLGEVNDPVYFHEFIERAHNKGLVYLSDTPVSLMYLDNLPEKVATKFKEIDDIVRAGQYIDFVRNQRFRNTFLCKQENGPIRRDIKREDIATFYLTYNSSFEGEVPESVLAEGVNLTFRNDFITFSPSDEISKRAMIVLMKEFGKPMAYARLCELVAEQTSKDKEFIEKYLAEETNLMRLVFGGLLEIFSQEGWHTLTIEDKPVAFYLARRQSRDQNHVTNLKHELVILDTYERIMLQYLDGEHTLVEILNHMEKHVENNDIYFVDVDGKEIQDEVERKDRCGFYYEQTLIKFAKEALIVKPGEAP